MVIHKNPLVKRRPDAATHEIKTSWVELIMVLLIMLICIGSPTLLWLRTRAAIEKMQHEMITRDLDQIDGAIIVYSDSRQ
jgi:hypothetical protein